MFDEPHLLDAMMADMEQQRNIHRPGPYWRKYAQRIADAIRVEGLSRFRASPAIGRGFVDVFAGDAISRMTPGWRKRAVDGMLALPLASAIRGAHRERMLRHQREAHARKQETYRRTLENWFGNFVSTRAIPDTTVAEPERRIELAGREVGELYLRTLGWVDDLSNRVDFAQVRTVFEIGGGFGAMAHTLLHLFPNIRKYLYLDIPPTLYVGTQYLKHFYGDAVIDYRHSRSARRIGFSDDDSREILAICPWQLETVDASCDFFWNSSSFQEMPQEIVNFYAVQIERLLGPDADMALYVYEGGAVSRTLKSAQVVDCFDQSTGFRLAPSATGISGSILPGVLFTGRR